MNPRHPVTVFPGGRFRPRISIDFSTASKKVGIEIVDVSNHDSGPHDSAVIPAREAEMPARAEVERALAQVEGLLAAQKPELRFPGRVERDFRSERSAARAKQFTKISLWGAGFYNLFLLPDLYILPDIINTVFFVQLGLATPFMLFSIYIISKKWIGPEEATTINLIVIFATIILFYAMSRSPLSRFLIFTLPACLSFGNVLLPLPFKMSAWFTGFCVLASSVALFSRPDWDPALSVFCILINASNGIYMLIGTYRMEATERRAYLFNLREKLRAEMLSERNRLLQNLSETDALTGIPNRRHFDASLRHLLATTGQANLPLSLLLIDIDHFKRLNDTFGHRSGDVALQMVARCLKQHSLPDTVVARYGGEEFAVLLPGANAHYARSCAEVLRSAVEHLVDTASREDLPTAVTISIGLATQRPGSDPAGFDLIEAADSALYRAKADGRNRVACSPPARTMERVEPTEHVRTHRVLSDAASQP